MSVKDNLITFIKGFILGVANVIPGVSGGTLAVTLGLYETLLNSIGNFFKDIKTNFKLLLPIILGVIVALITTSKLVKYALLHFRAQTIFLFVGLIVGGVSLLVNKTKGKSNWKNITIFLITFIIVIGLNFLKVGDINTSFENMGVIDYLLLVLIGFIASASMVIPGISGSFILMLLGYYEKIIDTVSNLTNFNQLGSNLLILVPFGIGVLIGIIFMAKLISKLLKKYETPTYFAIMGFVVSSVVLLILQIESFTFSFANIATCVLAFLWGYFLSRAIDKE